ncbi:MAG: hypothetical protein ACR2PV_08505 [Gammaproteobacteria bacterium]
MMIQFEISELAETLAENGTYSFTVTPKAALSEAMDIRWVIVQKGKIPITKNDFEDSYLEGTVVRFASGDTVARPIDITPTDDAVAEVSGEFEIQVYQVVSGGNDILLAIQDVTLTDDDDFSGVPASSLIGSSTANNFFFGGSNPLDTSGLGGDDAYVISRYQTGNVSLTDGADINTIKFDYGVEISSVINDGRGAGSGILLLGTDASAPTGTVSWAAPANWQYQIGDSGVLLSWTKFLEKLGLSGDGGALSKPYRVASLAASDSAAEGNYFGSLLSGSGADEVFAFGNDGELIAKGRAGDDIYIITRYQSDDVELTDPLGTNIIKLDYGVQIISATKIGFGAGDGELRLGTDYSSPKAIVTWTKPASWQYQIGDDVVLDWSEFLTALGPRGNGGELANPYNVGLLHITSNAEKIIFLQESTGFSDMGAIYTATNIANKNPLEIAWSLVGGDAALFEIDEDGAVTFKTSATPTTHVHAGAEYEFTIVATYGTQQATKNVTIDVVNANQAPTITTETTTGSNKLKVNVDDGQTEVTTIDAMDADAGDILAFSLSGDDASLFDISDSGELAFLGKPDFENPKDDGLNNHYDVTVRVTDGNYNASGSSSDADTRYFKYSGGELSKADGLVSVTAGEIIKANGTTFGFEAHPGLNVEVDSYIIVDDADNNGTYTVQLVAMLPDGDDYYALGEVTHKDCELTTYEPYYEDTIAVEVIVDVV